MSAKPESNPVLERINSHAKKTLEDFLRPSAVTLDVIRVSRQALIVRVPIAGIFVSEAVTGLTKELLPASSPYAIRGAELSYYPDLVVKQQAGDELPAYRSDLTLAVAMPEEPTPDYMREIVEYNESLPLNKKILPIDHPLARVQFDLNSFPLTCAVLGRQTTMDLQTGQVQFERTATRVVSEGLVVSVLDSLSIARNMGGNGPKVVTIL